jgi:hypothetical protein
MNWVSLRGKTWWKRTKKEMSLAQKSADFLLVILFYYLPCCASCIVCIRTILILRYLYSENNTDTLVLVFWEQYWYSGTCILRTILIRWYIYSENNTDTVVHIFWEQYWYCCTSLCRVCWLWHREHPVSHCFGACWHYSPWCLYSGECRYTGLTHTHKLITKYLIFQHHFQHSSR